MTAVIEVRGLVKRYGSLTAVDGVDLSITSGEFFGILGPNGAGKTTTLELIEGLRHADEGTITVLGEKPWPRNHKLLPRIGVQLQASAFFERLTCREQLETFARLYDVGDPAARADELLAIVGLTDKAGERTEKLSGGQMQRLSIAGSLIHDPEVVFLDEPTASLDPQARRNLWEVLTRINDDGRTVVLTTHHMDEAEILCDRVAIMDNGKVLTVDPPAVMIRALDAPTHILLPEGAMSPDQARMLPDAENVTVENGTLSLVTHDAAGTLSELAARGALEGLQVKGATLEDVFLTLTGREYRA